MLKKFGLIIACSFLVNNAKAEPLTENNQFTKINKSFKNYCLKRLFPLDSSEKLNPELIELKKDILFYSKNHEIDPSEDEIQRAWKLYLTSNFRSKTQLEKYLENQKLSLEKLQKKFYKRLVFEKYYELEIKPKLIADLKRREKALEILAKSNAEIENEKLLGEIYEYETMAGGKVYFEQKLRNFDLNKSDIVFYTRSEFAKQIIANQVFDQKIKQDPEFKKKVKQRIEEAYINAKNNADKHPKDYYFRQFYVSKDSESALEQISYLKNILGKNPNYRVNKNFFEGLTLFDMVVPANSKDEFYSQKITNSVTSLEKAGDISSIIESEHGYHIVQLKKVDSKVHDSLEEAYPHIYKEIKNKYISSLEESF